MAERKAIFVRTPRVLEMLGNISISTLQRMIARGEFPKAIKLSRLISVWNENDVYDAIEKLTQKAV